MNDEKVINAGQSKPKKRKKLPPIGYKINQSSNPNVERSEIQSMLLKHKELIQEQRIEKCHLLIDAEWDPSTNEAKVTKNCGQSLEIFGHCKNKNIYLYPEETLYLIEMNKLQLFFNGIRLSIQRSYSVTLYPNCDVTTEQYRIYKHFVVQGYKLFRHEEKSDETTEPIEPKEEKKINKSYQGAVFEKLQIFSPAKVDLKNSLTPKILYDVYLPTPVVKKSCRSKPHYYLAILSPHEKIWTLLNLVSNKHSSDLLLASVVGNTISVFNIQGIEIPNLF